MFAAEGSESSHTAEYSQLDALQARLETAFESITQINGGGNAAGTGGAAELGVASN